MEAPIYLYKEFKFIALQEQAGNASIYRRITTSRQKYNYSESQQSF